MKKRIEQSKKIALAGILSYSLLLGGCSKVDENTSPVVTNVETVENIERLSEEFINSQIRIDQNSDRGLNWRVLAADIGGAILGGAMGGIGGAIVVGAFGSACASTSAPEIPSGGEPFNAENEFDFVGEQHIAILNLALTVDHDLLFTDGKLQRDIYFGYAKNHLVSEGLYTFEEMAEYTIDEFNVHADLCEDLFDLHMTEVIETMSSAGTLSSLESAILMPYYEAFEAATSYSDFHDYSVDLEVVITSDLSIPESSKELILSAMSTTRHDMNYWNDF